jgi:hypothetical protein
MECAAAELPAEFAVSAAQDGLAAAARVAAMDVPINVRRFMGAFYSIREKREPGFGEKKGGPNGRTALNGNA